MIPTIVYIGFVTLLSSSKPPKDVEFSQTTYKVYKSLAACETEMQAVSLAISHKNEWDCVPAFKKE